MNSPPKNAQENVTFGACAAAHAEMIVSETNWRETEDVR